jgi:hypothetical protein
VYSHLSNKRGSWNKRGGGAKVAKSLNVEVGINVEGGIFGKNYVVQTLINEEWRVEIFFGNCKRTRQKSIFCLNGRVCFEFGVVNPLFT